MKYFIITSTSGNTASSNYVKAKNLTEALVLSDEVNKFHNRPNCDSYLEEKPRAKSIKQTLMKHENKPDKFKAYCNFCDQRLEW